MEEQGKPKLLGEVISVKVYFGDDFVGRFYDKEARTVGDQPFNLKQFLSREMKQAINGGSHSDCANYAYCSSIAANPAKYLKCDDFKVENLVRDGFSCFECGRYQEDLADIKKRRVNDCRESLIMYQLLNEHKLAESPNFLRAELEKHQIWGILPTVSSLSYSQKKNSDHDKTRKQVKYFELDNGDYPMPIRTNDVMVAMWESGSYALKHGKHGRLRAVFGDDTESEEIFYQYKFYTRYCRKQKPEIAPGAFFLEFHFKKGFRFIAGHSRETLAQYLSANAGKYGIPEILSGMTIRDILENKELKQSFQHQDFLPSEILLSELPLPYKTILAVTPEGAKSIMEMLWPSKDESISKIVGQEGAGVVY